jgi:hypothetical protein
MHDPVNNAALPPQRRGDDDVSGAQRRPDVLQVARADGASGGGAVVIPQTVDLRILMLTAVAALGGFSGGGVLSTVSTSSVQTTLAGVATEIKALNETLAKVQTQLAELQADSKGNARERDRVERRIDAIDERLRACESKALGVVRR